MRAGRNVWVMSFTVLATITCIFAWHRVLPNHLRHLGATDAQVGLAFTILALANRLPSVFGGWIADRFGRKSVLVVCTFLMAPMYALTGFMTTWTGAILALGLCWFFGSFLGPSITTIVADSVPEERRGRALGIMETFIMAAVCAGPWIGGRVIEATGSFGSAMRLMLVVTAGVYVLVALARWEFLIETHTERKRVSFRSVRLKPVWLLLVVGVVVYATYFLSTEGPFFALYAKDEIRLSESAINDAAFLGGLAAIAAAMVGGALSDRVGAPRVLAGTFAAMFAMLAPFAWAWWKGVSLAKVAPGLDLALYVLIFAPGEIFTIAFYKLLTSSAPKEHRALTVGLAGTVTGLFASAANLIGGRAYGSQGPSAPFALGAACAAVGTILALLLWWRTRNGKAAAVVAVPAES